MKAKSRLKPSASPPSPPPSAPAAVPTIYSTQAKRASAADTSSRRRPDRDHRSAPDHFLVEKYLKHLPLLFLGLVMAFGCSVFFQSVSPSAVQNLIFPYSYIPATILIFITSFLLASFICLNTRRGLVVAAFITTLIFLRLQQFQITTTLLLTLGGVFVIIELSGSVLEKMLSLHAGFKSRSTTRKRS